MTDTRPTVQLPGGTIAIAPISRDNASGLELNSDAALQMFWPQSWQEGMVKPCSNCGAKGGTQ